MNIEKEITFGGAQAFQSPIKQYSHPAEDEEMTDGILDCSPITKKHSFASPQTKATQQKSAACQLFSPVPQYKRNYTPIDEKLQPNSYVKDQFFGSNASPDFMLGSKNTTAAMSQATTSATPWKQ